MQKPYAPLRWFFWIISFEDYFALEPNWTFIYYNVFILHKIFLKLFLYMFYHSMYEGKSIIIHNVAINLIQYK
jgi:hypothetical protein